jgi:hypothetical protein
MSFMFIIVLFFCHWIITAWFGWVLANIHLPAMVSLSSWKLWLANVLLFKSRFWMKMYFLFNQHLLSGNAKNSRKLHSNCRFQTWWWKFSLVKPSVLLSASPNNVFGECYAPCTLQTSCVDFEKRTGAQ